MTHPDTPFAKSMRAAGISQKALAELAGVTRGTVWRWQHAKTSVPEYAVTIVRLLQHAPIVPEVADDIAAERRYIEAEREAGNVP
jgi:transcriptional regulator with XRE-family HTH domain